MANLSEWITTNTKLGGIPYSYQDHEYQEVILNDTSKEVNVRKCSQVGVSEASARMALAMCNVINPMTVIYTLPTAHFAATFMKTRVDTIIQYSDTIKTNLRASNDNSEVKQFNESFLYLKGSSSNNAPISIPADVLIHDELDFSDQEVIGQYPSRLTHSKWRLKRQFSTPTVPGYGIDKAFQNSRRFFNICKCCHCNHYFIPDYFEHVKIPDYKKSLREVNKFLLTQIRWQEAAVHCPKCDKIPDLGPKYREYICENGEESHVAAGYQVTPFDAPKIVTPSDLVVASTTYSRYQDFVNFGLGLAVEDSEATLVKDELERLFVYLDNPNPGTYVMGVDVGNTYHFVVGKVDPYGDILIVHTERVPMSKARTTYAELHRKYRVICTVIDSGPHAETVMALQATDPNLYASVYMRSKSLLTHTVVEKDSDKELGKEFVRQVNVNRSRALDAYMEFIRENHLQIVASAEQEIIINHHTSMKRVRQFDHESGEMTYSWQKTDGEDHYHHAFLYCYLAAKIRGVGKSLIQLPIFSLYKVKSRI